MNDGDDRALVRHASFNTLRHQFLDLVVLLKVTLAGTLLHRAERAHTAIRLVGAPLIKLDLAGRLLRAGEQTTDHYSMRTGGKRLRHISGKADAAVPDQRNIRSF